MPEPRVLETRIVDVRCGAGVTIMMPSNVYGCTLGDDTFVGPFVEIQRGVAIGRRCRIQSHSFICELVAIGDDCFIAHGVLFTNDLFKKGGPERSDAAQWKETKIGSKVSIGSGAVILPVSICDRAVIGAGAVVTRDITTAGIYAGNPARLLRKL